MRESITDLGEAVTIGRQTREWIVSAHACPSLALYHIAMTGISHASAEFHFVRHCPHFGQILYCFDGSGQAWVEPDWRACDPGECYVTPRGAPHAYEALKSQSEPGESPHSDPFANAAVHTPDAFANAGVRRPDAREGSDTHIPRSSARWKVCWVMYDGTSEPTLGMTSPSLIRVDGRALVSSIECLYREMMGCADEGVMMHWAYLVNAQAARMVTIQKRLRPVWERVTADLGHPWTLEELASLAATSPEHLRRIAHGEVGCSPMHHVAELRMRAAASLLASESYTVAEVAERVGYDNPFAFSTAFKRHCGVAPSRFHKSS